MQEWPPRVERRGNLLVVDLGEPARVASTGVDGGARRARYIIVRQVLEGEDYTRHDRLVEDALEAAGVGRDEAVTLLTAANIGGAMVEEGEHVWVMATVGLTHPACIGARGRWQAPRVPGTINIVAATRLPVSWQGLLDMLRVAAEAKAAAVSDIMLWCRGRPVGTVSDAVVVAGREPGSGGGVAWSGLATVHGSELALLVHRAVVRGDGRSLDRRLRDVIGMGIDDIVGDVARAYEASPVPGVGVDEVRARARRLLESILGDPNTWILLYTARDADIHARAGAVPGISPAGYDDDPRGLVVDELHASMLALYIQGWKGLLAAYWIDREKHRLGLKLAGLPAMLDDAAAALVGAVLSRVLDEVMGAPWDDSRGSVDHGRGPRG